MNVKEAHACLVILDRANLIWAAEGQSEVWAEALNDIDGAMALQVVKELARTRKSSDKALTPGDIRDFVTTLRKQRLQGAPSPQPPDELADEPKKFQRWIRLRAWAIGNGMSYEDADSYADQQSGVERSTLPSVPRPPGIGPARVKRP